MNVSLREIDRNNFRQCIKLKVAAGQEEFVAGNAVSIAESKIYPHLVPQAVYADETLVGFAMHGRDPDDKTYWIVRLMIDEKYQGKGYGTAAIGELIEKMERLPECYEIFLSYAPENAAAEKLYLRLGFERTGETNNDNELVMRLAFNKSTDNPQPNADN
jgi:diamine N-acetyltransferase